MKVIKTLGTCATAPPTPDTQEVKKDIKNLLKDALPFTLSLSIPTPGREKRLELFQTQLTFFTKGDL